MPAVDVILDRSLHTLVDPLLLLRDTGGTGSGTGSTSPGGRDATINFSFGGGGAAIITPTGSSNDWSTTSDPQLCEIPFPCVISRARMYAGSRFGFAVAVDAIVDVVVSQASGFGLGVPLNGTGARPALLNQADHELDLSGWRVNLNDGDSIIARLASFSGDATWVALVLKLHPVAAQQNTVGVIDAAGNQVVDLAGNPIVTTTPT